MKVLLLPDRVRMASGLGVVRLAQVSRWLPLQRGDDGGLLPGVRARAGLLQAPVEREPRRPQGKVGLPLGKSTRSFGRDDATKHFRYPFDLIRQLRNLID